VAFLEQALGALGHLPEREETQRQAVDIRLALRPPLLQMGRLADVLARSEEAEKIATALGDNARLARVYTYLINYHFLRGEPERALTYGERCLEIARQSGDEALVLLAERYLGQIHHVLGRYGRAREILTDCSERLSRAAASRPEAARAPAAVDFVSSAGWLAFTLSDLGDFEAGRSWADRAETLAEESRQPYAQAIAASFRGLLRLRRGDAERAAEILTRALAVCRERELTVWQPIPSSLLGLALARLGRSAEARPLLEAGVSLTERLGVQAYLALWTQHLAEGLLAQADRAAARQAATRALDLARAHGERGHEAGALRLLGEIARLGDPGEAAQAREFLTQSLELARSLAMRPLEAHCHLGLSRVALRGGDRHLAVARLTDALALFGEMEMLTPLREARDELKPLGRMFIVARERAELFAFLKETFVEDASVAVILDRRAGERRRQPISRDHERRAADRRSRAEVEVSLRERGLAIVG
jgi:tetratricopeptide (TPR) repeat protein